MKRAIAIAHIRMLPRCGKVRGAFRHTKPKQDKRLNGLEKNDDTDDQGVEMEVC
jgi:hypothetical protein